MFSISIVWVVDTMVLYHVQCSHSCCVPMTLQQKHLKHLLLEPVVRGCDGSGMIVPSENLLQLTLLAGVQ